LQQWIQFCRTESFEKAVKVGSLIEPMRGAENVLHMCQDITLLAGLKLCQTVQKIPTVRGKAFSFRSRFRVAAMFANSIQCLLEDGAQKHPTPFGVRCVASLGFDSREDAMFAQIGDSAEDQAFQGGIFFCSKWR
jgi:hypothetical protein